MTQDYKYSSGRSKKKNNNKLFKSEDFSSRTERSMENSSDILAKLKTNEDNINLDYVQTQENTPIL